MEGEGEPVGLRGGEQGTVGSEQWSGISMLMYNALHITQLVI